MATFDDERLERALQILADGVRRASEALQPVIDNDDTKRLQEYLSQADETAEWYRRFEQKANMSLFEIVYGKQPQPAQPTRRLVKKWIIGMFDSLDNVPISTVYTWTKSGAQILMFDNPYDTESDAEQALLEWEKDGNHADGEFVIMPVYRVEVTTGDGCPKCGGAPSRYYFGCDTLGCENYNDGSRTNPALKAKIDASITHD